MHPALVRHVVYPLLWWRKGSRIPETLAELEHTQWLPPERLRELQWAKLRAMLLHAYTKVPYYRAMFQNLGLHPRDIQSPDDLRKLPVLTKQVVRERSRELIAQGATGLLGRMTSGSTGAPMRSYIDQRCQDWWLGAEHRRRRWWGIDIGAREASLSADSIPRKLQLARYYLQNEGTFSCVDLSEPGMTRLFGQLVRFRPVSLRGKPSVLAHLARFAPGHRAGRLPLKVVWCTGEVLYADQRAIIGSAFHCPVVNEYGSTENELLAAECPSGRMHIVAENHYLEYRPAAPNGEGMTEVIITDLNNYGMPFIRYAIGDLGRPRAEQCPCGRGLPLLDLKGGRVADLVVMSGDRYIDNTAFCEIFEAIGPERIRQYRIIQETLDRFTVLVAGDASNGIRDTILTGFRRILGPDPAIDFHFVPEILPEPSGKLRHFISRLAHPAVRERDDGPSLAAPVSR